jgi:5,10-methylenetetrahydrofolate reductase
MSNSFFSTITQRGDGLCLYGLAPPKANTDPERLSAIAAQQAQRLSGLNLDGLVVYDIQDEAERTSEPRPFPFLPTLDPQAYASDHLQTLDIPKVVYRCVGQDTASSLGAWLQRLKPDRGAAVLVGSPTSGKAAGLSLGAAYELARTSAPDLTLGGVAIAERHVRRLDEHERLLTKIKRGCRFFVTQAVYDSSASKSLLSDYQRALEDKGIEPVPLILTFCPCASPRTLDFMKWLGISFPRWLENELRFTPDPLATSLRLCERVFEDVLDFARAKQIPVGINVESVSVKKAEIEASVELLQSLRTLMAK